MVFAAKLLEIREPAMADDFPYALFVEGKWDPKTPKLKNKLTIYFQSKKSNGGDCSVQLLEEQKATVNFKTEEVRQNVLKKQEHEIKLGQNLVSLKVYLSSEEASTSQKSPSPIKTAQTDIPHSDAAALKRQTEACSELSSGLDLKKPRLFDLRSQGSPAKDEKGSDEKTPQSEEMEHQNPTEETEALGRQSAVLENIQDMNKEFLIMLVENVFKDAPESKDFDIEVISENNCAVITFPKRKDAENFILSCPENSVFRRKKMDVRPLEKTAKVKVEDLPSNINSDYMTLYFEKFGEVDDVEMLEDGQSAVITFTDYKDVSMVLRTQHQIRKQPIKIFPYYESLGTALYGKDRPTLRLPEAFTEKINEFIWKYLQENQTHLDGIKQEMNEHFCQVNLQDPAVKFKPLASLLHQGLETKKLIHTWREKASAEFTAALSKYDSLEIQIQRDAWSEIEAEIQNMSLAGPVTLALCKNEGSVILAGLKEDVCRTGDVVQSTIDKITQRIQREKGSITDEIEMVQSIYEVVMKGGLEMDIRNSFPEMELSYHAHNQKLTLYGLKQEVLESKNKILQEVIGLKRRMVELHPSCVEFLTKRPQEELSKDLFLSKGLSVSFEIKDNQAMLVAQKEKTLKESEERLKAKLDHKCLVIEDHSVLRKAEWQDLITSLNETFSSPEMTVLINVSGDQVMISGFVDVVKLVQEQLSDFVENNSNMVNCLEAESIVVKFIREQKKQDWFDIVKNKVQVDFQNDRISLSGPRIHIFHCKPVFEHLLSSVVHCIFKVAKPGAKKFFKSKESMYTAEAKNNTGCLVELVDEHEVYHAGGVSTEIKGVLTPERVEIIVNKGDMCSYPVDAVVNAANDQLKLDKGLSKALSDAAGPQLQEACNKIIKKRTLNVGDAVVTKAGGRLCCKCIIHGVGPSYNSSNPQSSVDLLKKCVKRSLNIADRDNCQSIAIPAISSGSLGFPLDLCANTIVGAVKEFLEFVSEDSCLKKIHLIDSNDRTVEALEAAVQNVYGGSSTSQSTVSRTIPPNQTKISQTPSSQSSSSQSSSQSVKTNEGLTITLSKCNIQDTSADVVVNSVSADLSLNHGVIALAILSAAGPQLQVLLNQQATGKANVGAVFVTTGCNLKNKLVFHAVAPHWNQGQGSEQKDLEGLVDKCLDQAEQQKQGSIVFPAIGSGNLGFPKALVASIMLNSILEFSKKRSSKHVQEVMLALHPNDTQTIQAFTNEFSKKFKIQPFSSTSTQQQGKGPFSKITSKSGLHETTVGGVQLQVLTGDVTKERVDIIVNSSNEDFTLKAGVSKAILDAAGPNVEAECQQLGAQQNAGLIMTQPGNLQCKKIMHISAKNDPATIQKRVTQALQMCVSQNFTSISFPAFGTGQGGVNPGQVADAMLDALVNFVTQSPQSSLKLVRMVIFQAPMLADFHQSMQNRVQSDNQKKESTWSKVTSFAKSLFIGPKDKDDHQQKAKDFTIKGKVVNAAYFSICGPSKAAVDQAKQWIEKLISEDQAFEIINDSMIFNLPDKDRKRIQELQQSLDVSVRLEYKAQGSDKGEATIFVEGLARDVLMAASEIQTMLRRTRDEVGLRKDMDLTSDLVDWQYEEGGKYHSFDQLINFHLEQALIKNSTHVDIIFKGQAYKVTMPEGPAVSASGGNQMKIKRIDKIQAQVNDSLPQEWEQMASNELFKEYPLQSSSNEYKDVLGHFKKTCPNNVIKISRIQNPGMWKKYQQNKQIMEVKNGHQNNERKLFHGTRQDSIQHINHSGFNRSYAGMNAAAYGKGTYFALNANYSAHNTYSVPDAQGHKHMYLCRVLTGDFTVGNATMVVPPAKPGNTINLFDTVVNNAAAPSIFVVFRDDHAYPEYLITFT